MNKKSFFYRFYTTNLYISLGYTILGFIHCVIAIVNITNKNFSFDFYILFYLLNYFLTTLAIMDFHEDKELNNYSKKIYNINIKPHLEMEN